MTTLTITVPLPDKILNPNARPHWSALARARASAKVLAKCKARAALGDNEPPMWNQASAAVTFYWPSRRQRDPDNAMAALKATWDGLAAAGIVANDSGIWPERPTFACDKSNPRAVIVITREESR